MSEFLQQLLNGLSLGAIYALIAIGYTMVYGVLRFINFAHSDVFMAGAFIGLNAARLFPTGTFAGGFAVLAIAMLGCAVLGIVIERLAYRPLRSAPTLNVLITAIGVSLFLEYSGQKFFGAAPRRFPAIFPVRLIVFRTKMGTAMRAVSLNPKAAQLVGINNDVIISFTFGLGSALAAAGGVLYALNYPSIDPLMGVMPGLKAFVAAVLGGIGSIPGAALGGLILGIVETFVAGSPLSTGKDAIAFGILIVILLFRPTGLLGKSTVEKV